MKWRSGSKLFFFIFSFLLFFSAFSWGAESYVTLPRSELTEWKSELSILKLNLKNTDEQLQHVQTVSAGQQEQIEKLLMDSENLQEEIDRLLRESEIAEKEFKEVLRQYQTLRKEWSTTLERQQTQIENRRYWIGGAFIAGVAVGALGDDAIDSLGDFFRSLNQ